MSTPSRIAMIGSAATASVTLITNVMVQLVAQAFRPASFSELIVSAVSEAVGVGFLALVGIYFGARLVVPHRRNKRLMKLVALAHSVLGFLLAMPMKTHAIRVDMPSAGDASAIQILPVLVPVAIVIGMVLGALFLTRVLAVLSRSRDA